ncbi:MAG: Fe-S cluster assembly ATP-binding protein [Candidatus Peribacter riflensis]|uniref:Fe-S cluster assembly ATP-binding protein n=1 Tax=Candidatus Peribacter riflensis TaxID=1735162 RepID=A0A0S1SGC3_9BACT|nr:MAG: Fe-S cluster assembly ATP-binding protein [Candidatus Peribacter riflensis]ALM11450.1 MAG: Fe-S cluster assembly ATP-binding protein [Candidatus Peribacter riflensis]ALM12552.1 MAG: Fe-S cluster assembly ATP-binding protein [Candidatus Peribacter riflensis]ALM13653.1 MAG: Fe-S cluster assembly ATP-binding protein [Candidatus Peribacter riflensis]ALM14756.1 MAG: Fe-S cluster assembly ATP-binding protein [Candidatus Peribacter riflensis]
MVQRSPILSLQDLHVSVAGKQVVRGVSLAIRPGELHVLMGPNGAGKSSLAHALMGHPNLHVSAGKVRFAGADLLSLAPHERAQAGLFLAFQHPREIAGVSVRQFLYAALTAQKKKLTPLQFHDRLAQEIALLKIDPSWEDRPVHRGFSGGEKKKLEILQLLVLEPKLALLDETDSGLDLDALRVVADGLHALRARHASFAALLVTHNVRFLTILHPDHVHVMLAGTIVESGGPALARALEREGFARYRNKKSS